MKCQFEGSMSDERIVEKGRNLGSSRTFDVYPGPTLEKDGLDLRSKFDQYGNSVVILTRENNCAVMKDFHVVERAHRYVTNQL